MGEFQKPLRVLLIDDDESEFVVVRRLLSESVQGTGAGVVLEWTGDYEEALRRMLQASADVYLMDYDLGARSGLRLFQQATGLGFDGPVVFLTGHGDEFIAVETMKFGAMDYLVKGGLNPDKLIETLKSALARKEQARRLLSEKKTFERLAIMDPLTGLFNRRYFEKRLLDETARARRYGCPLSLTLIDLDGFSRIKDQYGHVIGDLVVAQTARLIQESGRGTDVVGSLDSDRFCILHTNTDLDGARKAVERIRHRLQEQPIAVGENRTVTVSFSYGLAQLEDSMKRPGDLLRAADQLLAQAKAPKARVS